MLKGKTALITGSSSGIGAATAIHFAQNGAKVAINYRGNRDEAQGILDIIEKGGGQGILVQADVSIPSDVKHMFEVIENEFGKLDILVNNAGVDHPKKFMELTIKDWDDTLKINLYGVFLCSQTAVPVMNKGGRILNTASVRGLYHAGRKGNIAYTVSKSGVISFTKTLAKELAPNIRVNAVAPGPTNTRLTQVWSTKTKGYNVRKSLLKRLNEPIDIANAFLFLASDLAEGITGEVLVVDGGYNLL